MVTTAFCIIGTLSGRVIAELEFKLTHDDNWFYENVDSGIAMDGDWLFVGSNRPCYVGIDAEKVLETMTIPQAKALVASMLRASLDMDTVIDLYYGEVGYD